LLPSSRDFYDVVKENLQEFNTKQSTRDAAGDYIVKQQIDCG